MTLPNRTHSSPAYRYGFQGQEKDDEIKGEGNSLNYTFRMHDPRVGRFFAVDPLTSKYPFYTPYSFSGNKVIRFVELEGLEEKDYIFNQQAELWQTQFKNVDKVTPQQAVEEIGQALLSIPESSIDGVTFTLTSISQSVIGGFSYGFGKEFYGDGYRTRIDVPTYKFSFQNGFEVDTKNASRGNPSLNDGFRFFEGITTLVGSTKAVEGLGNILRVATKFEKSGSKLVSTKMLEAFPDSSTFGNPSGTFMAPSKEIDELLSKGLSRNDIAKKLGINDPNFLEGDLIRIDIDSNLAKELNKRLPNGSEIGANSNFVPGGKTSGGVSEFVVDGIPKNNTGVKVSKIKE